MTPEMDPAHPNCPKTILGTRVIYYILVLGPNVRSNVSPNVVSNHTDIYDTWPCLVLKILCYTDTEYRIQAMGHMILNFCF